MDTKLLLVIGLVLLSTMAPALSGNPRVRFSRTSGAIPLIENGIPAMTLGDPADWPGVRRAAADLLADLVSVSGYKGREHDAAPPKIIYGTIGHSHFIDDLIKQRLLNVDQVRGKWEASVTQVVDVPGYGRSIVAAGADRRGTIYALYDLSEASGVSPWYWWADVPIKHHKNVYFEGRCVVKSPAVKYRGIFLNDEAPSLTNWANQFFGDYNHKFYEHIFELLLRLRANYLWPAMWNNRFSEDDPLNPKLADEYGIVMGTSHVEPMMRADKEWNRLGFTERQWNYATNAKRLEKFWRDGVERNKPYENIVTIAMRGKVDTPMSESANISLLEKIVAAQRRILAEAVNPDITQVPQLWCLYKEVQEYYEKGMRVPDDVTLLWADDNWGDIRRLPTPAERHRSGGAGVYYHFDYVGGPRNYKWIDTNPIPKVWEQMTLAHQYGADRIWIVNVGDLKPKAFSTEFFLRLAWDPDAIRKEDLQAYTESWAAREFGARYSKEIARIVSETARLNGRRKPELVGPDTYSLVNYSEADRVWSEFNALLTRAEDIEARLPWEYQNAFYELVLHSIKAPLVLHQLYFAAAANALYAKQGSWQAADEGENVRKFFARDAAVTAEYHSINGGKWNHMMDQTHIGYTSWQQPDRNIMPRVVAARPAEVPTMGVTVEGTADAWPGAAGMPVLELTRYGQQSKWIKIFSRSTAPIRPVVRCGVPWIHILSTDLSAMPAGGTSLATIGVAVDWSKAPLGRSVAHISVTTTGEARGPAFRPSEDRRDVPSTPLGLPAFEVEGSPAEANPERLHGKPLGTADESGAQGSGSASVVIDVTVDNPSAPPAKGTFLEGDGVVAIEAEHTSKRIAANGVKWETIPGYGRTLSAVEAFPRDFKSFDPGKGPCMEYKLQTFEDADATLDAIVSPSLAFQPGHGLRVAVTFDGQPPQVVDVAPDYLSRDWERAVSDSVRHVYTQHNLKAGVHTLRAWAIDPGVVIERFVLDLGGLKPSYLGPPESVVLDRHGVWATESRPSHAARAAGRSAP